jgi:hypothetical protein
VYDGSGVPVAVAVDAVREGVVRVGAEVRVDVGEGLGVAVAVGDGSPLSAPGARELRGTGSSAAAGVAATTATTTVDTAATTHPAEARRPKLGGTTNSFP